MTNEEYQKKATTFAEYGENPMYAYLGLAEEAGEVAGKVAKFIRHNHGLAPSAHFNYSLKDQKEKFKEDLTKELGDVLWFVAEIATLNNLSLSDLMQKNIEKLEGRKERGTIDGVGDDR